MHVTSLYSEIPITIRIFKISPHQDPPTIYRNMPTGLEEVYIALHPTFFHDVANNLQLVEFIHHGNTPIRQLAVENLVPYSLSQPAIFKTNQLLPVRDLKLLVRDYAVSLIHIFVNERLTDIS